MRLKNLLLPAAALLIAGCMQAHHPDAELAQKLAEQDQALAILQADPKAEAALKTELDLLWELQMENAPEWASYRGDRRFDDRVSDESKAASEKFLIDFETIAARVAAIPSQSLTAESRDTQAMVAISTRNRRQAFQACRQYQWGINGLGGPQVSYPMMPVFFQIRDVNDLKNLEKRYRATRTQIDQIIVNLRQGLKDGYTPTRINTERAIVQLEKLATVPIDSDPMLKLNQKDPDAKYDISGLKDAVQNTVRPALADYLGVLKNEVLPASRTKVGVSNIPGGDACYQAKIEQHIGPGYTPEQLHQIGLDELKWAQDGMMGIAKDLGQNPESVQAFMATMAKDPTNFVSDEATLLKRNVEVVARAAAALPSMVTRIPTTPVEVRSIEAHRAPSAPAAYYNSAPPDGTRPAIYYCNTYKPETRPLYNLEALAFHEAIPGHHLQIASEQERKGIPLWRKNSGQTAYSEGWALYAEILADELGLYSSPKTRFGMFNYQAWRAVRLVVDTGMHHMGWTRQQAIEFMSQNTALTANEVENEIDRYIAWPGQALAYMVGRRKIQELRALAEGKLGDKFDPKAFHDAIIGRGAVPLELLEKNIEMWIIGQGVLQPKATTDQSEAAAR